MVLQKISCLLGLAGVAETENDKAKFAGRLFGMLIIAAVLLMAFQWHMENKGQLPSELSTALNFTVWLFFIFETLVITKLVEHKTKYLMSNWMNLFIILIGSIMLLSEHEPLIGLLRSLRIIFVLSLFIPSLMYLIRFLSDTRLSTTIVASLVILILSGIIMANLDPGVKSIEDGIWWALITITTVGYGDVVPQSSAGRLFSSVLILIGLGIFSVITANFAALFMAERVDSMRQAQKEESNQLDEMHHDIDQVRHDDAQILKALNDIQQRLDKIEQELHK